MKQPKRPKRPGEGRPTEYKPAYAGQTELLCKLGATDLDLAKFFKVNVATIYRWKAAHREFCEAVKVGKERADQRVVASFYERAVGYDHKAEKVFCHDGKILRATVVEHVPADVGAAINWLKNRRPHVWRDKPGPAVGNLISNLSDEELNAAIRALIGG